MESLVDSLKKEREFAEAIVTHAPAGVVVHRDGEILFTNPKFFEMTGVDDVDDFCDDYEKVQSHDPDLASRMVFITGGAVTAAARDFVATVDPPLLYKPFSLDKLRDLVADAEPYQ